MADIFLCCLLVSNFLLHMDLFFFFLERQHVNYHYRYLIHDIIQVFLCERSARFVAIFRRRGSVKIALLDFVTNEKQSTSFKYIALDAMLEFCLPNTTGRWFQLIESLRTILGYLWRSYCSILFDPWCFR